MTYKTKAQAQALRLETQLNNLLSLLNKQKIYGKAWMKRKRRRIYLDNTSLGVNNPRYTSFIQLPMDIHPNTSSILAGCMLKAFMHPRNAKLLHKYTEIVVSKLSQAVGAREGDIKVALVGPGRGGGGH